MSKHTPGPWWNESGIIHARNPGVWTPDNHSCVHVAEVRDVYWENGTNEEAEANANLIAAAPDMYEALKAMLDKFDDAKDCGDPACRACRAVAKAKAAIAKAEGRT